MNNESFLSSTGGTLVRGEVAIGALRVGAVPAALAVRATGTAPVKPVVLLFDGFVLGLGDHSYMTSALVG